jgi:hypothetical protein
MVYPNSTPEFRILKTNSEELKIQVRYSCPAQGYLSKWQDVPVVEENNEINKRTIL